MDAFINIASQLGIDHTLFYLFALMFPFYLVLRAVYLKPFQKLLHDRKEKTEGMKKEAEALSLKADAVYTDYKLKIKDVHEQARHAYLEAEKYAKNEEAKILAEAAMKSKTTLQAAQKELDAQKKATLDDLAKDVTGLASEIAEKILGRSVRS